MLLLEAGQINGDGRPVSFGFAFSVRIPCYRESPRRKKLNQAGSVLCAFSRASHRAEAEEANQPEMGC